MLSLKDLAVEMQLHPRTVKRWWKKLNVPPHIAGYSSHRWTKKQAETLFKRWKAYWKKKNARLSRKQICS